MPLDGCLDTANECAHRESMIHRSFPAHETCYNMYVIMCTRLIGGIRLLWIGIEQVEQLKQLTLN